jgi:hypothetical protein
MLPSTLNYLYSVRPFRMILCAMLHSSIAHSIICTVRLFRGKMHSDWFNGIDILQSRWQHGGKAGYCYLRGLEKTLCEWDIYIYPAGHESVNLIVKHQCVVMMYLKLLKLYLE